MTLPTVVSGAPADGVVVSGENLMAANSPPAQYAGGVIAADWPTAWKCFPTEVDVVCARDVKVALVVDGIASQQVVSCPTGGTTGIVKVPISSPLTTGALHIVCVRSAPVVAPRTPLWTTDPEDSSCRAIVVIKP